MIMDNLEMSKGDICVRLFDQIIFEAEPLLINEEKYAEIIDEGATYLTEDDEDNLKKLLKRVQSKEV